jgi:hypothetical protein
MSHGSKRWLPSSHLMGYMEATESLKYPYLITRYTSPSRAVLEVFRFSPSDSDGCPATALRVASTQALRSRRVSSASKLLAPYVPVRLVLAKQPRPIFGLGFVAQPSNPVIFW